MATLMLAAKPRAARSGQPIIERLAEAAAFQTCGLIIKTAFKREGAPRKCGAMSEQAPTSGRGNEQVPQKLVHLVGYRDPNAGPDRGLSPKGRILAKR